MEKNTPKDAGRQRIGRVVVIAVIALLAASIAWWLLVYGREEIDLAVIGGKRIRICGASLTLSYLSEEKIAIRGEINGVRYLEDV